MTVLHKGMSAEWALFHGKNIIREDRCKKSHATSTQHRRHSRKKQKDDRRYGLLKKHTSGGSCRAGAKGIPKKKKKKKIVEERKEYGTWGWVGDLEDCTCVGDVQWYKGLLCITIHFSLVDLRSHY